MTMERAQERVGFIGLGLMGHGMAKNIIEKGYPLTVIAHRKRAAVDDLVSCGAVEAASMEELAGNCSVILMCLTGAPEVTAAIAALKPGLAKSTIIVDCSTSDPTVSLVLAAELAKIGVDFVDAPLSRTPKEAWAGTLDCMVGASDASFARVQPILATWAAKIVHLGGVGDGHKMKLLNNFLSLGYAALYSEALALSRKVGIPATKFDQVIRGGRMDCGFYQTFMGYTIDGNREAHKFTLGNAYKDIRYVEAMANSASVATPMASAVKNSFALAIAAGGDGAEDYVPHLPDFIAKANGL
jgi:3-hydroxyisobutyrate dehydrogenase-like beta-hydroxyacid dehydrogenase